jgi:hypothetical protein
MLAFLVLATMVYGCAIYATLSRAVRHSADYRFFPPFKPHVDANRTRDLASENFNIATSLVQGQGFANPFVMQTGPTAWMPPLLPLIEAGLLWTFNGNRDTVIAVVVFLQVNVLLGTGILVFLLVRQTTSWIGGGLVLGVLVAEILRNFSFWFQMTQDCWLVLLALDLLLAGLCWGQPLLKRRQAAAWGVLGGFCALVSPVIGFAWVILTSILGVRQRLWSRLGIALLAAVLTLAPWTIRNYLVFGRLIPIKSNLAYELYQSQCLLADGILQGHTFARHPYQGVNPEGKEYARLGEMAFLDLKREQCWTAVAENPLDFLERTGKRLLAATLWYEPGELAQQAGQPWMVAVSRLLHALPFLGLLVLLMTSRRRPLQPAERIVAAIYLLYLLPYIVISYWERYTAPLLAIKMLLVLWAIDRLRAFAGTVKPRVFDRAGVTT